MNWNIPFDTEINKKLSRIGGWWASDLQASITSFIASFKAIYYTM